MPRIAYVNGRYLPHRFAAVHIEDRGYQFADGVYEVIPMRHGRLVDEELHLDRLERSLAELAIPMPMARGALRMVCGEVLRRNLVTNGLIYMQVTRGVAPRDHRFPPQPLPALVVYAKQTSAMSDAQVEGGVRVITVPDIRWGRCDIKSVGLLANCLARQQAAEAGVYEAWQVDRQGEITEGSVTNAWIVTAEGRLVTRPASSAILNGVTRVSLLRCAEAAGIDVELRPFTVEEALNAREAFLTSSSNFVLPVTEIDGRVIGNGRGGSLTMELRAAYLDYIDGKTAA